MQCSLNILPHYVSSLLPLFVFLLLYNFFPLYNNIIQNDGTENLQDVGYGKWTGLIWLRIGKE
jgi:ABC-type polysaccharide transport system permease subunit